MFLAIVLSILLLIRPINEDLLVVLGGGTLIFALGLLDDIFGLRPYTKLAGQIAVACLMIAFGIHAQVTWNPFFYIPMTILWIVGITNAFNLLDNMDGLAGGIALISLLFMGFLSQMTGGAIPMDWVVVFLGSIGGFLLFNRHPAKIFMGDCGAQWLGFMIACLAIVDTWHNVSNLFLMIATPVLVLAVPIFDTALVALNRKIQGRPLSQGGRDHSSHRLVALGLSQKQTVSVLWGLSILFGLVAVFSRLYSVEAWALIIGSAVIFSLVFGLFLGDARVDVQAAKQAPKPRKVFDLNLMYKRRIVEIIIDTILIGGAYTVAYLLRYDWSLDHFLMGQLEKTLPLIVAIKLIAFLSFGLYRGLWTYIDFDGFLRLLRVTLLSSVVAILVILGTFRFEGFSRTLFAIDFVVLVAFMTATRALLRALRESIFAFPEGGVRILVVGAGDAGRYLLNEIRKNRQWNLRPVALLDDDERKKGKKLLDIPIVGNCGDIWQVIQKKSIERIIIAIPSASNETLRELERTCDEAGIPHTTMPSLEQTLIRELLPNA